MVSCRGRTTRAGVVGLVGAALAAAALPHPDATAGPSQPIDVVGVLDYEPVAAGEVVESVADNSVSLTFSPDGGGFTATASLSLVHDVPARGCRFDSTHVWEVNGEFRPGTLQFAGEYVEITDETVGACENFTFTRTFDPDVGPFIADLDPATGAITSRIRPLTFVLDTDPAPLAPLVPDEPPPIEENALTEVLDDIRSRHDPITASGPATGVTSDASIVTNAFVLEFNPLGGPSSVTGELGVRTDQTLDDGRTCSWVTTQTIEGSGDYDAGADVVTGVFRTMTDREVLQCDFETTFAAPPPISGTYSLSIDLVTGRAVGDVGGFALDLPFDPGEVPPVPSPQFRVRGLDYGLEGDVFRVGVDWEEPWPPDEVGSLLVAGEVTTPDGPIVFGFSLQGDVASTFMEPDGPYSAVVTGDGHTVLEVGHPRLADATGRPIRITTWHADTPDGPGTRLATFGDEIDPVGSPLGPVQGILTVPFDLPSFWETGQLPGAEAPEEPLAEAPAEPAVDEPQEQPVASEPSGDGGGFPWPFVVIPIAGLGAVAGFWWRRRRGVTEAGLAGLVVHVRDISGRALPGAEVRVNGHVGVTDGAGDTTFPDLAPGSYGMTVRLEGFATVQYPAVVVTDGPTTAIEVELSSSIEEVITVTSESPLLDERKIHGSMTVTADELGRIPTATDPGDVLGPEPESLPDQPPIDGVPEPLPEQIEETLDIGETRGGAPVATPTPEPTPEPVVPTGTAAPVAVTPSFVPTDDGSSFPLHAPVRPDRERTYVEALCEEQLALDRYANDLAYYRRAVEQRRAEANAEQQAIYAESMAASTELGDAFDHEPYTQAADDARDRLAEDLADLEELRDDPAARQRRFLAIEDELDRHAAPVVERLERPRITLRRSRFGRPIDSLLGDQEFYPEVEIPNTETPPEEHIVLRVTSQRRYEGDDEPTVSDSEHVTLDLVGLHEGNWVYSTSAPVTLRDAHSSGLRDRLGVDFDNGDEVVFEHLGSEYRLHAWDRPDQQWDGEVRVHLEELHEQYTAARERVLRIASAATFDAELDELNELLARGRQRILEADVGEDERQGLLDEFDEIAAEARQRLVVIHNDAAERDRLLADIDTRLRFVASGLAAVNSDEMVQDRAMRGQLYVNLALNPYQDVNEAIARAERNIDEAKRTTFTAGMKGVGIAFGQAIADMMIFPAIYGIVVGEDFVTGRKMSRSERIQTAFWMVLFSALFLRLATVAAGARVRVGGPPSRRPMVVTGRSHRRGGGDNVGHSGFRQRGGPAGGSNMTRRPPTPRPGRSGRGPKPPLDEVLPPIENVRAPKTSLDQALPPLERVAPPRSPSSRPTTRPAMTDTQRVTAPKPADVTDARYQPGKPVPGGHDASPAPDGIVYLSPPARTTFGYWRAVPRLDRSAGVARQRGPVDCWPTAVEDAARVAGHPEIASGAVIGVARQIEVDVPITNAKTGQVEIKRLPTYGDPGSPGGGGTWPQGQVSVLQRFGAQATQMPVTTPGQFVGLGAYASQPGRSVLLGISTANGGGHAIRLLGVRNQGGQLIATVADPGPGIAFDVRVRDLFQQTDVATTIRWSP